MMCTWSRSHRTTYQQARKEAVKKDEQLREKNERIDMLLNTAERKSNQLEAQRSEIILLRRDIAAAVSFYVYLTLRWHVCERQLWIMRVDGCLATSCLPSVVFPTSCVPNSAPACNPWDSSSD